MGDLCYHTSNINQGGTLIASWPLFMVSLPYPVLWFLKGRKSLVGIQVDRELDIAPASI